MPALFGSLQPVTGWTSKRRSVGSAHQHATNWTVAHCGHGMATVLRALLAPYDHRTRALVAAPAASERPSEWAIVMAAEYVNAEKDGTHIGAVVDLAKMFDRALFSTLQPETPDA